MVSQSIDPKKDVVASFSLHPEKHLGYFVRYGNTYIERQSPKLLEYTEVTRMLMPEFARMPLEERIKIALGRGMEIEEVTIKLKECPNTNCQEKEAFTMRDPIAAARLVDALRESGKFDKVSVLFKVKWKGEERIFTEGMFDMAALLTGSKVSEVVRPSQYSGKPTNYIPKLLIMASNQLSDEEINELWRSLYKGQSPLSKEVIEYMRRIAPAYKFLDEVKATAAKDVIKGKDLTDIAREVISLVEEAARRAERRALTTIVSSRGSPR
jgi:hypothetical protein